MKKGAVFVLLIAILSSFVFAGELKVTNEHPFLVNSEWILAKQLVIGDLILTYDGKFARITDIEQIRGSIPVYNLEDSYYHNYVVGDDKLVVHNSGKIIFGNPQKEAKYTPLSEVVIPAWMKKDFMCRRCKKVCPGNIDLCNRGVENMFPTEPPGKLVVGAEEVAQAQFFEADALSHRNVISIIARKFADIITTRVPARLKISSERATAFVYEVVNYHDAGKMSKEWQEVQRLAYVDDWSRPILYDASGNPIAIGLNPSIRTRIDALHAKNRNMPHDYGHHNPTTIEKAFESMTDSIEAATSEFRNMLECRSPVMMPDAINAYYARRVYPNSDADKVLQVFGGNEGLMLEYLKMIELSFWEAGYRSRFPANYIPPVVPVN